MTAALPLILKLQAEAANPDASLTNLLRMAKIAATKLNLKDGVVGEEMHFSEQEKGEAEPVTQQFIIQNVGVLGSVTDQASVTNQQTATAEIELDFGQVSDFLTQARTALPQLPQKAQEAARPLLETIDGELKAEKPNSSKIREALGSLRKIGEGIAGNLTAQGIIAMVKAIVGA